MPLSLKRHSETSWNHRIHGQQIQLFKFYLKGSRAAALDPFWCLNLINYFCLFVCLSIILLTFLNCFGAIVKALFTFWSHEVKLGCDSYCKNALKEPSKKISSTWNTALRKALCQMSHPKSSPLLFLYGPQTKNRFTFLSGWGNIFFFCITMFPIETLENSMQFQFQCL